MVPIDKEGNLYLVEEYFAATNERTLCLPKGAIDPGETEVQAAIRELRERLAYKRTPEFEVELRRQAAILRDAPEEQEALDFIEAVMKDWEATTSE